MGVVTAKGVVEDAVTHGMCAACAKKLFAEIGGDTESFLNGLGVPVVVVDDRGIIRTANAEALNLLDWESSDLAGYRGGDILRCVNAKLPGGCGNSPNCSGCAVRRAVIETFESGKSSVKTPAMIDRKESGESQETEFVISTEKTAGVVLLRIDEMSQR